MTGERINQHTGKYDRRTIVHEPVQIVVLRQLLNHLHRIQITLALFGVQIDRWWRSLLKALPELEKVKQLMKIQECFDSIRILNINNIIVYSLEIGRAHV